MGFDHRISDFGVVGTDNTKSNGLIQLRDHFIIQYKDLVSSLFSCFHD